MEKLEYQRCKQDPFKKTDIEVRLSPIHRYGVFATKDFSPKDIIEECPMVIFQRLDHDHHEKLLNLEFNWDNINSSIALGYGSIYNHADEPNAMFHKDFDNQIMRFIADKHIFAGEEILINYGAHWFPKRNCQAVSLTQQKRKNDIQTLKIIALLFVLLILSVTFPIST